MRLRSVKRPTSALVVAALALTTVLAGTATAQAAPAVNNQAAATCPLTNVEKSGAFWDKPRRFDQPGILYTAPGLTTTLLSLGFDKRPIGTLTLATSRGPRTVVSFCADAGGWVSLSLPADTLSGPATIAMASRDGKKVFRQSFTVVALDSVPEKPTAPTDIQARLTDEGIAFSWTPTSARPEPEAYDFNCKVNDTAVPQVVFPRTLPYIDAAIRKNSTIGFSIMAYSVSGQSPRINQVWRVNPDGTMTRVS